MKIPPRYLGVALPLILCLVAFALYHVGFPAPLYYDSALLPDNVQAFAGGGLRGVINLFPQRPVTMASFYLNYLVSGMDPSLFRVLNTLLMGAAASGVVVLMLLVLDAPVLADRGIESERKILAFLFGLLFLVHPVQTYLVLYVWQRMALLACCLYILAFAAYLGVRTSKIRPPIVGYVLSFVLFAMAVLSKENAITLPAVIVLAEVALFKPSVKELSVRTAICAACTIALVVLLSFLERPHGTDAQSQGIVNTLAKYYEESGLTVKQVFITQCRLLFVYASIIVCPLPSKVLLVSPQVIHGSLADSPWSLAAVVLACTLPLAGLYALWKRPLSGFGILFFLVNLLPEAVLVPQFLFFVYRASLPMVGLFLVLLDGIIFLLERCREERTRSRLRKGAVVALSAAIVVAGLVTRSKAELWTDPVRLWTEVVDHMPHYGKNVEKRTTVNAFNNLGIALQKQGSAADAAYYHRLAVAANPLNIRSHVLLAKAYIRDGRLEDAKAAMKEAIAIAPRYAEAHMGLAVILLEQNRLAEAAIHGKKAVELAPDNARYHHDLGVMLMKQGDNREAVDHFARSIELNPAFVLPHYQLGKVLSAQGNLEEAAKQFRRTVELKPDHVRARNDLAGILVQTGHTEEAIAQLREILKLNPNDKVAQANLTGLLQKADKTKGTKN